MRIVSDLLMLLIICLEVYVIIYTFQYLKKGKIRVYALFEYKTYEFNKEPIMSTLVLILQLGLAILTLIVGTLFLLFD
jgi:hypothetical protein